MSDRAEDIFQRGINPEGQRVVSHHPSLSDDVGIDWSDFTRLWKDRDDDAAA